MKKVKRVKTRELLRNFKQLKEMLLEESIQHIVVDLGAEKELELSLKKEDNTAENLAKKFSKIKKPIHIERSDIFETLFDRS